jgi:hypothetical protein
LRDDIGAFAQEAFQVIRKAESVNEAEENGEKVDGWKTRPELKVLLPDVTERRNQDSNGDQKFNPFRRNVYIIEGAERKGDGMPDGKGGDQDKYTFPVVECVPEAKCHDKDDMIVSGEISDMFKAEGKV